MRNVEIIGLRIMADQRVIQAIGPWYPWKPDRVFPTSNNRWYGTLINREPPWKSFSCPHEHEEMQEAKSCVVGRATTMNKKWREKNDNL